MAEVKHRWASPGDWLGDKINAHIAKADAAIRRHPMTPVDVTVALADLACIACTIVNGTLKVDSDMIQDAFQDEMEEDGYFKRLWEITDIEVSRLDREQIAEVLEGAGIQCYDTETKEVLITALVENLNDGTIDEGSLPDVV